MMTAPQGRASVPLRELLKGWVAEEAIPSLAVSGIQSDSRNLESGQLFLAIDGLQCHGLDYSAQAVSKGCAAIAYDPVGTEALAIPLQKGETPFISVPGLSENLGILADRFYGAPSSAMAVIGVTGTNGKTSCTHFIAEATSQLWDSGVIGTLGWGRTAALEPTRHTTPDPIELQRIMASLRDQGCRLVAMEASSHGLSQGHMKGVRFTGAVFTNFSRDHLDYHGTMDAYLEAKLALAFWPDLEFIVFSAEQAFAEPIVQRSGGKASLLAFCSADYETSLDVPMLRFGKALPERGGMSFDVTFGDRRRTVRTGLYGDFNVENITATLGVLLCLGIEFDAAIELLEKVTPVPGRMERVECEGKQVVVDYAHTPDALATVLEGARQHAKRHLWVVFGCGGDRDRGKRPEMGAVASEKADYIILTDDNPRSESGDEIIQEILKGISHPNVIVIRDRRDAIRRALNEVGPDDFLVVAGKGHETTQEIAGIKYPFNDRDVIQDNCPGQSPTEIFSLNQTLQRSAQG